MTNTANKPRPRRFLAGLLTASAMVTGLVFAGGAPAYANETTIDTYLGAVYDVAYLATPYTNTKSKNSVAFMQTINGAGGSISLAVRPGVSSSGTYARGTASGNQWSAVRHDNGNAWLPAGTFYVSVGTSGGCGGAGCGSVHLAAKLQYNVQWF